MPPRLGELLIRAGACTPAAVREALQNQVIFGGRLGTNLLELRAVTEPVLAEVLGKQHGLPALCGDLRLDPQAVRLLSGELADRYDVVPYVLSDRRLAVLACDPSDLSMLDEVAFATGKQIHGIVVPEARIWALLRQTYRIDRHLRGIDVAFDRLRAPAVGVPTEAKRGGTASDLMDEVEFDAIYGKTGSLALPGAPSAPAASPPGASPPADDEVLDLLEEIVERPAAPAVLDTFSRGAGHAPPPRFVPAARHREEPEPSPLGFAEAVRFLEGVEERDAIARTVLRYARARFGRAVLLTVNRGEASGWAGLGEGLSAERVRALRLRLGLGHPGIVDTVVQTRAHFLGPIPKTDDNVRLLKGLGGGVPQNAFVVPILALGRVVNVFYGDAGRGGAVDPGGIGELLILATRIAQSYDALLARVRSA